MKTTTISVLLAAIIIGGAIIIAGNRNNVNGADTQTINNVSVVGGKQIIEINAKGGYAPRITKAKANMPTIIKVGTRGTFDCSSALSIPSLGYRKNLPPSGETLIDVPPQKSGSTLRGICAMGMYSFQINFE